MSDIKQKDAISVFAECASNFWRALQRHNVFYLASALLMLAGCYMVCIPYLYQRELSGLLVLLGAINVYELMVIIACCFIMRRTARSREPLPLVLVELLFLFDVTFTINACVPLNFLQGTLVSGISLLLGIIKLFALEVGSQRSLFNGMRVFLNGALVFLYSFQVLIVYAGANVFYREITIFFVWLAFGILPLLLPKMASPESSDGWWATAAFKKTIATLAFVVLSAQLVGQSWVYGWSVSFAYVFPFLFALIVAVPFFTESLDEWDTTRAFFAMGLAGFECVFDTEKLNAGLEYRFGTMATVGMVFAAACCALMWLRERRAWQANLLCLFAAVAILGGNAGTVIHTLFLPNILSALLLLPVGAFWIALRPTFLRSMVVMSVQLVLLSEIVAQQIPYANAAWYVVQFWPACALLLSVWRSQSRTFRTALAALVVCVGVYSFSDTSIANVMCFAISGAALATGMLRSRRSYAVLLNCYVPAGLMRFYGSSVERVSFNWGWIAIVAAFALFALAFSISRKELSPRKSTQNQASP